MNSVLMLGAVLGIAWAIWLFDERGCLCAATRAAGAESLPRLPPNGRKLMPELSASVQ